MASPAQGDSTDTSVSDQLPEEQVRDVSIL